MSQGDYIQNKKIILQLQRQIELKPILDSSFYTLSKAHSIERDVSNTIVSHNQLTLLPKVETECDKFITCSNTNLRPNRMTFERRMVNDYRPFIKHRKLGIYNKFCYDSSYNLIHTNNSNRLFSAYSNKRLKNICNCTLDWTLSISVDLSLIEARIIDDELLLESLRSKPLDKKFMFRTSNGQLIMPYEAVYGQTYSLYSFTSNTLGLVWQFCDGLQLFVSLGPYDSVMNNNPSVIPDPGINKGPREYSPKFVFNYGITYLYLYGSNSSNIINDTDTYYAKIAIWLRRNG